MVHDVKAPEYNAALSAESFEQEEEMGHPCNCPPRDNDMACPASKLSSEPVEGEWVQETQVVNSVMNGYLLTAWVRLTLTGEE